MKKLINTRGGGLIVTAILALVAPILVGAQTQSAGNAGICDILAQLQNVATIFAYAIGVLAVIMLLYAAFLFLTQSGSEDGVANARKYLIYALVGVAVALLAFNAVAIAKSFLSSSVRADIGSCPKL